MDRFDVPEELTENPYRIRVAQTFSGIIERAENTRSVTPGSAKNYFEFCELVKTALDDYQSRLGVQKKLLLNWEQPDKTAETEVVSISLLKRAPGAWDQGAPFEGSVKNLRPIIRESKRDTSSPGYRKVVMGKWYDNLIQFTCWAQTNKEAIKRAFWFEEFIEKYTWYFKISGVQRVIFTGQEADEFIDNDGKKLYGRPLLYYVKTEELTEYSEKEIEEIFLKLIVNSE